MVILRSRRNLFCHRGIFSRMITPEPGGDETVYTTSFCMSGRPLEVQYVDTYALRIDSYRFCPHCPSISGCCSTIDVTDNAILDPNSSTIRPHGLCILGWYFDTGIIS